MSKIGAILIMAVAWILVGSADANACAEVEVMWVRGSGEEVGGWNFTKMGEYLAEVLSGVNYHYTELEYPAVAIGTGSAEALKTTLGAKISGGEAYDFGKSVDAGVEMLLGKVKEMERSCPATKFALAGYSQGAMVITKSLRKLQPEKIIYAANFGDPKLYLPEGEGLKPRACTEGAAAYSDYRVYVPDCYAYEGILGGYKPYVREKWRGKVGVWCNYHDIMCSTRIDWENIMGAHLAYDRDGRLKDGAEMIGMKVHEALGHEVTAEERSGRDVAFVVDATSSMIPWIERYRDEAKRLAREVLDDGGRVALYQYRDLRNGGGAEKLCDFGATYEEFVAALNQVAVRDGGDRPESLLASAMVALNELRWQVGANKSVVVLTDAGFHNPDFDGTTIEQVAKRAKEIDPVHFYVISPDESLNKDVELVELTKMTDGRVFTMSETEMLTEEIMGRAADGVSFDDKRDATRPRVWDTKFEVLGGGIVRVSYKMDAYKVLVAVNEAMVGFENRASFEVEDLDLMRTNSISLIPYSRDGVRGETALVLIPVQPFVMPVVPNTGDGFLSWSGWVMR